MDLLDRAAASYRDMYGRAPSAAGYAPGRVEIMGNHTDYNGGYVLPAALSMAAVVVGSRRDGTECNVTAADLNESVTFSVLEPKADADRPWASYVMGVVSQLQQAGVELSAFDAVVSSTVPAGAGLSSSAAIEVATAMFLQQLYPYDLSQMAIAELCQRAENRFVGVNCGILDQFSSVFGQQDSLLFLDCKTLEHDVIRMGRDDIAIIVCNSNVAHELTDGDYNTRRAECMAAAAHFGKTLLRDVPWEEFLEREGELPENQRKRARHVLSEDRRVLAMRTAIAGSDTAPISRLLAEGHASCRDLFQNSVPEIDLLVEIAVGLPGCIGSKLTGGGWGGSTVNLVQQEHADQFIAALADAYKASTGRTATTYSGRAGAGARGLALS